MWHTVNFNAMQIKHETDKATLIQMPNRSEYKGWGFFHPSKLVRENGGNGYFKTFSFTDEWEFRLVKVRKRNNQTKYLDSDDILDAFEHQQINSNDESYLEDGYTMPIVCYYIEETDEYEIVDGFHRYTVMLNHKDIYDREKGMLPVSVIDKPLSDRMASTIRHNRARGEHSPQLMSKITADLVESGMSDAWIMKNIGMDADELLRMKQVSGIAALFKDKEFSNAWE